MGPETIAVWRDPDAESGCLKYRRRNARTCHITDEMDNGLAFGNVSVELVQRPNARSNKVLLNVHSNIGTMKLCASR